ncbi:HEAT repeat domain-containing protein [Myxococcota bacterium]|nr:HEAT repeat domain-containing protein [Myxococcota bacterium]
MEALIDIGKQGHPELAHELFPFLTHPDPDYRSLAIQSLGLFLKIPEAKSRALAMWATNPDPDDEVREAALSAWYSYYRDSKDVEVMRVLLSIVRDKNVDKSFRGSAYLGLLRVSGFDLAEAPYDGRIQEAVIAKIAREHGLD